MSTNRTTIDWLQPMTFPRALKDDYNSGEREYSSRNDDEDDIEEDDLETELLDEKEIQRLEEEQDFLEEED